MSAFAVFTLWFLNFVNVARFQEIFPFLAPLQLGKLSLVLGLVVVCAQNARDLKTLLFDSPVKKYLLTIVILAMLGLPFSVYIGDAIDKFKGLLQMLLITSVIVALGKKNSESMKLCFIFMLLFLSIQTVLQTATGRVSVSATYDPNDIAVLSIILLPIALSGLSHTNFAIKMTSLAASAGGVACIALSGSRGGLLALLAVTMYAIILEKKRRMLLIALCGLGALLFSAMAGDVLWERIQSLIDGTDYNFSTAGDSRMAIWTSGFKIMLSRPIFGVGIGQFVTGLATLSDSPWKTAHNSFLQIGMELGLGGLWAFCAILFFIYRLSVQGSQADYLNHAQQKAYTSLRLSLLGFCVGGFLVSHAYSPTIYTLICYSVVMYYNLEDAKEKALQKEATLDETKIAPSPPPLRPVKPQKMLPEHIAQAQTTRDTRKSRLEAGDKLIQDRQNLPPK